jgi:rhamnosyltransferase
MPPSDNRPSVAAVIAAYSPPETLLETVRALLVQVPHVVVVDDGSPADLAGLYTRLAGEGAVIIRQPANLGIAAALNAGLKLAETNWEPTFFLTLDQDSVITDGYVERALRTHADARKAGIDVGVVCAASYSGHPVPTMSGTGPFVNAFDPMQSGFVIPRSTVDRIGRFDEGLFIDGVDSEYTMRARSAGLSVLVGAGCDIAHDLGQRQPGMLLGRPVRLGGREISYNYHSPARVYYISRNGTILTLRYALKSPGWTAKRLVEELKAHVLRFSFSPGRSKLLRAAARGFVDGVRGVTGRIPVDLERRIR